MAKYLTHTWKIERMNTSCVGITHQGLQIYRRGSIFLYANGSHVHARSLWWSLTAGGRLVQVRRGQNKDSSIANVRTLVRILNRCAERNTNVPGFKKGNRRANIERLPAVPPSQRVSQGETIAQDVTSSQSQSITSGPDEILNDCVSCMTNKPNVVFIGCGHMAVCMSCAPSMPQQKCPICRVKSRQIQVFFN